MNRVLVTMESCIVKLFQFVVWIIFRIGSFLQLCCSFSVVLWIAPGGIFDDRDLCYCPYNMQTSRLICDSNMASILGGGVKYCYPSPNLTEAVRNMHAATLLGVTEAYQESICLFHANLLESLPDFCNCDSPSWTSYASKAQHGVRHAVPYNETIDDMPQQVLNRVDEMTREDRQLYKAAVTRFIADIEKVERRFGSKILCEGKRKLLDEMTSD